MLWRPSGDSNALGFNIYRQFSDGTSAKINPALIAGPHFAGPVESDIYAWPVLTGGKYIVEVVGADGNTIKSLPVAPTAVEELPSGLKASLLITETEGAGVDENGLPQAPSLVVPTVDMPRFLTSLPSGNQGLQRDIAARTAYKILVTRNGWQRLSGSQLFAAGLPTNTAPGSLRLYVEGKPIPLHVPQKATLAPEDNIEFYGQPLDLPGTGIRVYWLVPGFGVKNALTVRPEVTIGTTPVTSFWNVVEDKPRSLYYVGLLNGESTNFFGPVITTAPVERTLNFKDLVPVPTGVTDRSAVIVSLQGVTQGVHSVEVSLNGTVIGTVLWTGRTATEVVLPVASTQFISGGNTVSVKATAEGDLSLYASVRMRYHRQIKAVSNSIVFQVDGNMPVRASNFNTTPVRVVDITNAEAPFEIPTQVDGSGAVKFQSRDAGTRLLHAFAGTGPIPASGVQAGAISTLALPENRANYLVVAPKAFRPNANKLLARRLAEGMEPKIVNLETVLDQFGYGIKSAQGLRNFFNYANNAWALKPKYIVLVGDASYDGRNFLGAGAFDLMPTKYIDSAIIETASDDWLTDFNNDGISDIPTGRITGRNGTQITQAANRIASYKENAASVPGRQSVIVSDTLRGYNFAAAADATQAALPAGAPVTRIRREDGDAAARSALLAAWNASPVLVTYFGHGSTDIWSGAPLLSNNDATTLKATQPQPLVLAMTCLTNYFVSPTLNSLGETIFNSTGGGIAVWGSSGQTIPNDQEKAAVELAKRLYPASGPTPRLGDAILQAKAVTTDEDVRRTWLLLGDPAMIVARPQPAPAPVTQGSGKSF